MKRHDSVSVVARNGLILVGLAILFLGIIEGAVGAAQFYRPNLWTHVRISDVGAVKDGALHAMAVGGAAFVVGLVLAFIGGVKSRRSLHRDVEREPFERPSERTIVLDRLSLEPMPDTPVGRRAPLAEEVWVRRLAVDLQQQRLMNGSFGTEKQVDIDLYALALRNLVQIVRAAQAEMSSGIISRALTDFVAIGGENGTFTTAIEGAAEGGEGALQRRIALAPSGTEITIGNVTVPLQTITAAADVLANVTVGELTNIRSRATTRRPAKRTTVKPAQTAPR